MTAKPVLVLLLHAAGQGAMAILPIPMSGNGAKEGSPALSWLPSLSAGLGQAGVGGRPVGSSLSLGAAWRDMAKWPEAPVAP